MGFFEKVGLFRPNKGEKNKNRENMSETEKGSEETNIREEEGKKAERAVEKYGYDPEKLKKLIEEIDYGTGWIKGKTNFAEKSIEERSPEYEKIVSMIKRFLIKNHFQAWPEGEEAEININIPTSQGIRNLDGADLNFLFSTHNLSDIKNNKRGEVLKVLKSPASDIVNPEEEPDKVIDASFRIFHNYYMNIDGAPTTFEPVKVIEANTGPDKLMLAKGNIGKSKNQYFGAWNSIPLGSDDVEELMERYNKYL